MTAERVQPVVILLAEDNAGDIRLVQEALTENKIANCLHVARDGVEAMAFLRREGEHAEAPRPDLILLDLNMPRKGGREVLQDIKADPTLRRIPVVVLTSSDNDQDLLASYDLYANAYITKPLDLDRFVQVVKAIEDFWFSIVRLPRGG